MKPKRPLTVNPTICRPMAADDGGNRENCFVEGCNRPSWWHSAPPKEEIIRQSEAAEKSEASDEDRRGSLVLMCSRCALYRSILFQGRMVHLRSLIKSVESRMRKEGKIGKPFARVGGKLTEEEDCRRILGSIVMTSIAFMRRDEDLKKEARS